MVEVRGLLLLGGQFGHAPLGYRAVGVCVGGEAWVDAGEVPEGAVVAEFVHWQLSAGTWKVSARLVNHLPSLSLEAEHTKGSVWGKA